MSALHRLLFLNIIFDADDHPAVMDELMPRLIHCCYADKWPQRIGGVAAVSMVVQKLPMAWLQSHMPDVIKAALAVLKHLPSHASLEQAQLLKSLTAVMHLVVPQVGIVLCSLARHGHHAFGHNGYLECLSSDCV